MALQIRMTMKTGGLDMNGGTGPTYQKSLVILQLLIYSLVNPTFYCIIKMLESGFRLKIFGGAQVEEIPY